MLSSYFHTHVKLHACTHNDVNNMYESFDSKQEYIPKISTSQVLEVVLELQTFYEVS